MLIEELKEQMKDMTPIVQKSGAAKKEQLRQNSIMDKAARELKAKIFKKKTLNKVAEELLQNQMKYSIERVTNGF